MRFDGDANCNRLGSDGKTSLTSSTVTSSCPGCWLIPDPSMTQGALKGSAWSEVESFPVISSFSRRPPAAIWSILGFMAWILERNQRIPSKILFEYPAWIPETLEGNHHILYPTWREKGKNHRLKSADSKKSINFFYTSNIQTRILKEQLGDSNPEIPTFFGACIGISHRPRLGILGVHPCLSQARKVENFTRRPGNLTRNESWELEGFGNLWPWKKQWVP